MERKAVDSSNLASIGYDPSNKTLEVEFHSSGVYQYHDVPQNIYDEFVAASSKGKFLNAHIKDNFRYSKIG